MSFVDPEIPPKGHVTLTVKQHVSLELLRGGDLEAAAEAVADIFREAARLTVLGFEDIYPKEEASYRQTDCGCPPYGTCMNVACPRALRIT